MRWLMIGLLVSVGALLFAAAGVARHIWLHRTQSHRRAIASTGRVLDLAPNPDADRRHDPAEETDL
jgi:hypothetical protein